MSHDAPTLHNLLDSAAPDAPDLPATDRITAVTARGLRSRRRRRVAAVGVVLAAVTAIGVPVLLTSQFGQDRAGHAGEPVKQPTTTYPGVARPTCPGPKHGLRTLAPAPDTYIGDPMSFEPVAGAVCYGVDPMGSREYRRDVGRLSEDQVAAVWTSVLDAAGRPSRHTGGCTDAGPTRLVVFLDASGERLTLTDTECRSEFAWTGGVWKPTSSEEDVIAARLGGRVRKQ